MNDNDKTSNQEQEQPITQWPGYAHLVLAFSILFSLLIFLGSLYVFQGMIGTTVLFEVKLPAWTKDKEMIIVFISFILIFFAGAFVFFAFKENTEGSAATSKAVILVCRILFYPVHVVVRTFLRVSVFALLPFFIGLAGFLGLRLYSFLETRIEDFNEVFNGTVGAALTAILVSFLPNTIIPAASKVLANLKDVIDKMYELPLFPGMVVKESLSATKQAVNEVDKKIMEFITKLLLLVLLIPVLAIILSLVNAATTDNKNGVAPPPVQQKASYVFLGNMPWIVGNVQSFFSSAVVFPKDAKPREISMGIEEGSVTLNDADRKFYAAIYKPLLDGLARCGTGDEPVKIELSGFASSAPYNATQADDAERQTLDKCRKLLKNGDGNWFEQNDNANEIFNLCVAKKRAVFVKEMLEGFVKERNNQAVFNFTVRPWVSLAQMKAQTDKIFCDGPKYAENQDKTGEGNGKKAQSCQEKYSHTRGLMNRRVDIAIVETPYCMI